MKKAFLAVGLALLLAAAWMPAVAQAPIATSDTKPGDGDEAAIRAAMTAQAEAWNRGDIPAFMQAYEDSPETTFIGSSLRKGFRPILERYKASYTTREQMGKLSFTAVEVRLFGSCGAPEVAVVTGRFHLQHKTPGQPARKDDGVFSLVWRKNPQGWKIVLDHTS